MCVPDNEAVGLQTWPCVALHHCHSIKEHTNLAAINLLGKSLAPRSLLDRLHPRQSSGGQQSLTSHKVKCHPRIGLKGTRVHTILPGTADLWSERFIEHRSLQ